MSEVRPGLAEDASIAQADLSVSRVILTPLICTMGENAHLTKYDVLSTLGHGRHLMMGDDPRLPKMPAQPTLADFFRHRFVPMVANHLLQSASLARKAGLDEKSSSDVYFTILQWPGLLPVIMDIGEPN